MALIMPGHIRETRLLGQVNAAGLTGREAGAGA